MTNSGLKPWKFVSLLSESTKEKEDQITDLKQQIESGNLDVEKVEDAYREIDKIEKEMLTTD